MPELPEVEAVRRTLETLIVGKKIQNITAHYPKIIKQPNCTDEFISLLRDETFRSVGRKGKFLILYTDQYAIVSHLRMEGKFILADKDDLFDHHTHVFFHFYDGKELRYRDVRKFGTMHLTQKGKEGNETPVGSLGPDVIELDFTPEYFEEWTRRTTRPIKNLLLDQTIVAGLGNIYVDEVLYASKVHPMVPSKNLSKRQIRAIVNASKSLLEEAVELGGTTIRTYENAQGIMGSFQNKLKVYGKTGEECVDCGTKIMKIKVGGRGTHYCPKCQIEHKN